MIRRERSFEDEEEEEEETREVMEEEADEGASWEGGAEAEANSETVIVIKSPVVVASG